MSLEPDDADRCPGDDRVLRRVEGSVVRCRQMGSAILWDFSPQTTRRSRWRLRNIPDGCRPSRAKLETYDFPSDATYTSFVNTVKSLAPEKGDVDVRKLLLPGSRIRHRARVHASSTLTNALMFSGLVFQSLVCE
ncbi:hypothetical protein GGX14DRAFT_571095 [Mycena pura]|uniref:Uncharacterized protein n=1 Tax=Mycena pura TaxID=153505 RepID=A0AAD6V4A2_9AGAR|nr:hypothetical protein GGX14DRAFT_571095 [Mycena pura]